LRVSLRTRIIPRSGREREGVFLADVGAVFVHDCESVGVRVLGEANVGALAADLVG